MTKKKDYAKPCEITGICPYGSLVEFFPLAGKTVEWNGQSLKIDPIQNDSSVACQVFSHDCPIFYVGTDMLDKLREDAVAPGTPLASLKAFLEYDWDDEATDYEERKEIGEEFEGHVFEHMYKIKKWLQAGAPAPDAALTHKQASDYVLKEDQRSVWITVNNISVYVVRNDEGVSVDLFPLNAEMDDPLTSAWALFADAEPDIEE